MKKIIYGNNKNIISENLKTFRIQKGLTQNDLAAKMQTLNINLDQQMISKIEKNLRFVTDYELVCFCLVLEVEVKEMLQNFFDNLAKQVDCKGD